VTFQPCLYSTIDGQEKAKQAVPDATESKQAAGEKMF